MTPELPENRLILVLDTNICLDLFVFNDPRWKLLLTGLQQGKLKAITKNSCRDEWLSVLHYKQLPITDENRPAIIHAFDKLICCTNPSASNLSSTRKLPICSDPDDQQFMELARDSHATHLITKDKALLKCAKKVAQLNLFLIMAPDAFINSVMLKTAPRLRR